MDKRFIARGVTRTSQKNFFLWLLPWIVLLIVGIYAAYLCLAKGLNQTNMDNRFAFGLWIYLDLSVIALGAGAFFTGFLLYIMKRKELKAVINSAVVLGLICYSGAVAALMVDVGQPLRAWFTFWYPNVHSMLTEVTFCLTCYLTVLAIEYIPILLKNRQIKNIPSMLVFEYELHKVMVVFAAVGTFLSLFHQGSLGGLYGVLTARPFAYRPAIGIWPTTFFLFIVSAAAAGPSFILVTTWFVSKISKKKLVRPEVLQELGKISGVLLFIYIIFKSIDTFVWLHNIAPSLGFTAGDFYRYGSFGIWILIVEVVVCGWLPAIMLLRKKVRSQTVWLVLAATLACAGIVLNRFVMTIQTLALPTLPFDRYLTYTPSWQEITMFLAVLAYGVLLYSCSFRYLTLFPQERELQSA
ncbi:MAG TPA: menaquinone reductase integral membrane subunit QrcD [Bacteroidota bacterium]|nr:menaquinone reductase integral membrane subunit QrcD [Bacteroidota bacterium]